MTKFGKLVDGQLEILDWRKIFIIDGVGIHSRDPEFLLTQGYKPVIYNTAEPEEGYIAEDYVWEETNSEIIQKWNYVEYVVPEEEKNELEIRVDDMDNTISILTECILEISEILYA